MKAVFLSVGICMWFQLGYLLRATYVVIGIDSKKQIENRIGKNQFLKRLIVYQKRLSFAVLKIKYSAKIGKFVLNLAMQK